MDDIQLHEKSQNLFSDKSEPEIIFTLKTIQAIKEKKVKNVDRIWEKSAFIVLFPFLHDS